MSDPAQQIGQHTVTCLLCQKNIAVCKPLNVPLEGAPGKNVEKLFVALYTHLTQKHQEELAFYIFSAFRCDDPSLQARLERVRVGIFEALGLTQPTV
jgi:hypothetical protein